MNKKTTKVLARIARNVPKHLQEGLVKTVVDTSEEDMARIAIKDPNISTAKKRELTKMLDAGMFRRSEDIEDEGVMKQIDEYNEREVKKAIRRGEIPPPSEDSWIAKRNQKIKTMAKITGKIIPIKDKVLLRPEIEKGELKTNFGVILPDSAKKRSAVGTVEAVGADVTAVKIGMKVAYQDYDYEPVELNGETFYIMKEASIIAIFT